MNLIVIGNGFDIAHGIPSKYSDFENYLKKNKDESLRNEAKILEEIYNPNDLWKDFENTLGHPTKKMVEKINNLFNLKIIGKDFAKDIQSAFESWIKHINKVDVEGEFVLSKEDIYLNFNYTSTLESTYNISDSNILHIHNFVALNYFEQSEGKLIFGHNNKFPESGCEDIVNATYKNTKKILEKEKVKDFFERIKGVEKIIVAGCSYSFIDFGYFEKLKNDNPNAKWIMGCFSKQDENEAEKYVNKLKINNAKYESFDNLFKKLEEK